LANIERPSGGVNAPDGRTMTEEQSNSREPAGIGHMRLGGSSALRSGCRVPTSPWWLMVSWATVALGMLGWFLPVRLGVWLVCPLRILTGIPCATCGATHAAIHLLRLELWGAIRANPLVALLGLGAAAACVLGTPLWLAGRLPRVRMGRRGLKLLRVAVIVAVLTNWLYLILTLR
jgi:hypothetical protein